MNLRGEFKLGQSEFNDFLVALVGEEKNGQEITVLSAFSRRGLDPWREAARLSSLSKVAATDSLTHTIASLPEGNWQVAECESIAGRLVATLPKRRSQKAKFGQDQSAKVHPQTDRSSRAKLDRGMSSENFLRRLELPNWLVWIVLGILVLFVVSRL